MVYIPGGVFMMGSPHGDSDERPVHRVKLWPFYMDQYEITNIQYRKFIKETNYPPPPFWDDPSWNDALQPVVGVSWGDAVAYAEWAGKRLPTEAEWELAARSTDGREYSWGNLWHEGRSNSAEAGYNRTVRVGTYPEGISPYGIHDIIGNVWEWCFDNYDKDFYKKSPEHNPSGPEDGNDKVLRGGAWGYDKTNLRASNRFWDDENSRTKLYGFRCVRDASE
jgi:iron(II)-dependent oxidoreductase